MINIDFFKKIRFNRCELLLNETESYYLYSKFHDLIVLNESKDKVFSKTNIYLISLMLIAVSVFGIENLDLINYYKYLW